ncbi:hypothetical protein BDV93DRAFT_448481 [Ceratobasidium sp. AG-I]|nr:hypothetical protein BDV93DRAFT_448481 [Ceratobasidium sp. AG-I]
MCSYCGHNHELRASATCRLPYPFAACLAHVEITIELATRHVVRVQGILGHNMECQNAPLKRVPALSLHPSVLEIALQQLQNGASLTDIQERNREMVCARHQEKPKPYHDQDKSIGHYRYLIRKYDSTTLYRQQYHREGVDTKEKPHINIHNWLNLKSSTFNPTLASAIFHYAAQTDTHERLEICISTPEMKEATWQYADQKQIILDGTFGICNRHFISKNPLDSGAPLLLLMA